VFGRGKKTLEKRRIEALSMITRERVDVEAMAQRPRSAADVLDNALLETVLKRLAEIEARAREAAHVDDLDDLEDDAETQGEFSAHLCPVVDVKTEGERLLDQIEGWGIPRTAVSGLRELFGGQLGDASSNPASARSALRSLFEERNEWDDYADDYEDTMWSLARILFWSMVVLLPMATLSFHFAVWFSPLLILGLLCAGAAGSCVSVVRKMPALDVSLSGELDAYRRRVLSRM
jgi:hypothetical protein